MQRTVHPRHLLSDEARYTACTETTDREVSTPRLAAAVTTSARLGDGCQHAHAFDCNECIHHDSVSHESLEQQTALKQCLTSSLFSLCTHVPVTVLHVRFLLGVSIASSSRKRQSHCMYLESSTTGTGSQVRPTEVEWHEKSIYKTVDPILSSMKTPFWVRFDL